MSTNFPISLDDSTSLPYPSSTDDTNSPSLAGGQDNQNDAVIAVETKLGTGSSTPSSSNLLISTGTGTSAWSKAAPTGTIVGTSDTQTLTNKTLTSPTINTPTIANPTLTVDSISGYTSSNTGTIYGMSVASGILASAALVGSVNNAAIQAGALYVSKFYNPYKFAAYASGTTSLGTASFTKVAFATVEYDTGSNFDNVTNYRFVPPVNGYYQFFSTIQITAGAGGETYTIALYKGGSIYKNGTKEVVGASGTVSLIVAPPPMFLNATTDYIEIYGYSSSASKTVSSGQSLTYFGGYLVSAT